MVMMTQSLWWMVLARIINFILNLREWVKEVEMMTSFLLINRKGMTPNEGFPFFQLCRAIVKCPQTER